MPQALNWIPRRFAIVRYRTVVPATNSADGTRHRFHDVGGRGRVLSLASAGDEEPERIRYWRDRRCGVGLPPCQERGESLMARSFFAFGIVA
jgi:hypothetical protein